MANVKISAFPVPFALPVAGVINGTETLPMDQTVGGVVTTVSSLFSRLLGSLSVTYPTGLVTAAAGLTVTGAAFTSRGILDSSTTTSVTIAAGRNVSIAAPTAGVALTIPSTSTLATAAFGNTNFGLNVGLSGSGENIYTTAATLSIGTVGANSLFWYTNSVQRSVVNSTGNWTFSAATLAAGATLSVAGIAAGNAAVFSTPSDTQVLINALTTGQFSTIQFTQNTSTLSAQIFTDNTNNTLNFTTNNSAAGTIKFFPGLGSTVKATLSNTGLVLVNGLAINGGAIAAQPTGYGTPVGTPTASITSASTLAQVAGTLAAFLLYMKGLGFVAA